MNIKELEAVQYLDGSFGRFHSMSSDNQITTEKALRRFLVLGLNKDNKVVNKCLVV